jgi:hypothetical protein
MNIREKAYMRDTPGLPFPSPGDEGPREIDLEHSRRK